MLWIASSGDSPSLTLRSPFLARVGRGDTLTTFLGVKQTGWYIAIFAASNFLGAVLLSRLFDTVGRVRMIAGTYLVSGSHHGRDLGLAHRSDADPVRRDRLLRLGGRQLGLSHGERDLPA